MSDLYMYFYSNILLWANQKDFKELCKIIVRGYWDWYLFKEDWSLRGIINVNWFNH